MLIGQISTNFNNNFKIFYIFLSNKEIKNLAEITKFFILNILFDKVISITCFSDHINKAL